MQIGRTDSLGKRFKNMTKNSLYYPLCLDNVFSLMEISF